MHDRTLPTWLPASLACLALIVALALPVTAGQAEGTADGSPPPNVELQAAKTRCQAARDEWKAERRSARDEWKAGRDEWKADRKSRRTRATDSDGTAIDALYTDADVDQTGVVRTDLGIAEPATAPGEELGLWHYRIPAGQTLAPHTHPGWQLARVTAGELEYSVISGEGQLLRADGSIEPMGPGTYLLATGDGVIENPDLVHFGANRGDEVVTIISATLFTAGAPVATLVEEPQASAAATDETEMPTVGVEETAVASPAT